MPPYSANLRVYEPLVAFREPARAAWALYSDPEAEPPDPHQVLADEARGARRRLAAIPPVLVPERESDRALVRRIDETTYVCPLETRMRSVLAYSSLTDVLPREVLEAAIPSEAAAIADERVARADPETAQCHVREARWHVPVSWFILFRQSERRLVLVPDQADAEETTQAETASESGEGEPVVGRADTDAGRTMSYLTRMVEARQRLARALAVLRKTVEGAIVEDVESLGRWLEEFHPHALVELDYGGLVRLVDDGFLLTDRSVVDVADGLAALAEGDGEAAAQHYGFVVTRWAGVERQENAN